MANIDEGRSLYKAVLANPGDDLSRLVFADWLDEHEAAVCRVCHGAGVHRPARGAELVACTSCRTGRRVSNGASAWASLIRWQIALARSDAGADTAALTKKASLLSKCRRLKNAFTHLGFPSPFTDFGLGRPMDWKDVTDWPAGQWCPVSYAAFTSGFTFDRGFIGGVYLSVDDVVAYGRAMASQLPLSQIHLLYAPPDFSLRDEHWVGTWHDGDNAIGRLPPELFERLPADWRWSGSHTTPSGRPFRYRTWPTADAALRARDSAVWRYLLGHGIGGDYPADRREWGTPNFCESR